MCLLRAKENAMHDEGLRISEVCWLNASWREESGNQTVICTCTASQVICLLLLDHTVTTMTESDKQSVAWMEEQGQYNGGRDRTQSCAVPVGKGML